MVKISSKNSLSCFLLKRHIIFAFSEESKTTFDFKTHNFGRINYLNENVGKLHFKTLLIYICTYVACTIEILSNKYVKKQALEDLVRKQNLWL